MPTNITAVRGQDITFNCSTDAGPGTMYIWLYNISNLCESDDVSACVQPHTNEGKYGIYAIVIRIHCFFIIK